ncbi:MAG TPA: VWA domain-containing protein [Conexibacter sp.]|jgi:hypothetical protein
MSATSPTPPLGTTLVRRVAELARRLHAAGGDAGPARVQTALLALDAVDLTQREDVYWALRCALVSHEREIAPFDAAFASVWQPPPVDEPTDEQQEALPAPSPGAGERDKQAAAGGLTGVEHDLLVPGQEGGEDSGEASEIGMTWSAAERLRKRDFATYGDAELRAARLLVERIARARPRRRSRRFEAARRGRDVDQRRTLRRALRTDGYPLERAWRRRRRVPRTLVFLVDVSGSMEPYARAVFMFLQAAVAAGRETEAYAFGTRLTCVTAELDARDPDRALRNAARAVPDWAGGTRIGDNLAAFNARSAASGLTRGAVVVIVSDGWERGGVELLDEEMARLRRRAHTVVWVNPLAGEPDYEPLAQGMATALPHVDRFLPGHNLEALEALAGALERLPS